jgi:FkbM family methyltransferase
MKINDTREDTKLFSNIFISNLNVGVYIFGLNKYGVSIASWLDKRHINVIGYIDDYSKELTFNNLPVYKSNIDFTGNAIINCVVEGRTIDVEKLIKKLNPLFSGNYISLEYTFEGEVIPIDFLENTDSILENKNSYLNIYSLLNDQQSKDEFRDLINFRLNRNIYYLKNFKYKINEQYFEDFVVLPASPIFIDGGGFDGSTSLEFINNHPYYEKIYYFEPTEPSMDSSKLNLINNNNIHFFLKGLWSHNTKLHFNVELGSANKISDVGRFTIDTISLDNIINSKVDFIKLDIEGAEVEAINGAKNIIEKYKPKLAICIYHKQTDFINIPKIIMELNPDYKVYLRHYTQGVFETVMYFV